VEPLVVAAGRRDGRSRPEQPAAGAAAVLGDIAQPAVAERLTGLLQPSDPAPYRLAVARALTRLGHERGPELLDEMVSEPELPITERRRALELLGWYGDRDSAMRHLDELCDAAGSAAMTMLCLGATLAVARRGPATASVRLDKLLDSSSEEVTRRYIDIYRRRLDVVRACRGKRECLVEQLEAKDWRARERAVLELGEVAEAGIAVTLAQRLKGAHPEVIRAILVSLERRELTDDERTKVAPLLRRFADAEGNRRPAADLLSWSACLAERLSAAEEQNATKHEKSR
jgi:HEAT repeat protein